MRGKLEILKPKIFPKGILSGVTKKNKRLFSKTGIVLSFTYYYPDEKTLEHRRVLANNLNLPFDKLKFQKQVHESNIRIVDSSSPNDEESDGMITSEKGLTLNISIADCCAILICDKEARIVAALHSGWRGTRENIAAKGIAILNEQFDLKPENLLFYLSPCASKRFYQVGEEVAKYFPDFSTYIGGGKYLFDNKGKILSQLLTAGAVKENVEISNICTIENTEFHSHRRDGKKSGRMSAFIGIRNDR